jgi:BirA family biotin operon repressor/biotin-[acetyl-CoA-carboxylase] ligase
VNWNIHHSQVTASTNLDARQGSHGDVFSADMQTAGRGRLDHKWHSRAGQNLLFSAVVDIAGLEPGHVSTFPLVVGLAVAKTLSKKVNGVMLKWPNDIWVNGRKICGILCERFNDNIIAGVGVNVKETSFPDDIASRSTSLALEGVAEDFLVPQNVLREILGELSLCYSVWKKEGFPAIHKELGKFDALKGRSISVLATDDDEKPLSGVCDGIDDDGTLIVNGVKVWAGEAHVLL